MFNFYVTDMQIPWTPEGDSIDSHVFVVEYSCEFARPSVPAPMLMVADYVKQIGVPIEDLGDIDPPVLEV